MVTDDLEQQELYLVVDDYGDMTLFRSYNEAHFACEITSQRDYTIDPVTVISGHVKVVNSGNVFAIAATPIKKIKNGERVIFSLDLDADLYAACSRLARHVGYSGVSELIEATMESRYGRQPQPPNGNAA